MKNRADKINEAAANLQSAEVQSGVKKGNMYLQDLIEKPEALSENLTGGMDVEYVGTEDGGTWYAVPEAMLWVWVGNTDNIVSDEPPTVDAE